MFQTGRCARGFIPGWSQQSFSRLFYFSGLACCHISRSLAAAIADLPPGRRNYSVPVAA
jgi:hypothetical protein